MSAFRGEANTGKRLELLRGLVPNLQRVAVMTNVGGRIGLLEMAEVQTAAQKLGLQFVPMEIRRAEDIAPALDAVKGKTAPSDNPETLPSD